MAENLKTTRYRDDTPVSNITDDIVWMNTGSGAYCWYDNDASLVNKTTYGALYNWHAVSTGKLCPTGWHVPTKEEWIILATYPGGSEFAGGRLKETGTAHWQSPNTGADNVSGFAALPGGLRDVSSDFGGFYMWNGSNGMWWTSNEGIEPNDHGLWLDFNSGKFSTKQNLRVGVCLTCYEGLNIEYVQSKTLNRIVSLQQLRAQLEMESAPSRCAVTARSISYATYAKTICLLIIITVD